MTKDNLRLPSYGGQALIEGVLMRGEYGLAAAMRSQDGEIVIEKEELKGIYKSNIKRIPFLRGVILLWDALGLGMRYLTISANVQTGEDEKIEGPTLYLTLIGSLALAVGLFFVAPALLGGWFEKLFDWSSWWSNLAEGFFRLFLAVAYIWAVGKMEEIKRVFQYHGAEHKTINAFEARAELTPENVSLFSVEHPRCGTSFTLSLIVISIVFFTLLGPLPILWRALSRILLIPILAGIAYEYIKWTSKHMDKPLVKALIKPNMSMQKLTTREPDLSELEVSIAAFNAMIELETELKMKYEGIPSPEMDDIPLTE